MIGDVSRAATYILGAPAASQPPSKKRTHKPSWNASSYKGLKKIEDAVLRMINALRRQKGLGTLVADPRLRTAARQHTQEMIARNYYSHLSPTAAWSTPVRRACHAGYLNPYVTENINVITGHPNPAAGLYSAWIKSPGHYNNIVHKKMTRTGIGVAKGLRRGRMSYFATQLFADSPVDFRKITLQQTSTKILRLQVTLALSSGVKIEVWKGNQYLGVASPVPGGVQFTIDLPQKRLTKHSLAFAMKYHPQKAPKVCSVVYVDQSDRVSFKHFKHVPLCQLVTKARTTTKRMSATRWTLSGETKANTAAGLKARFYMNNVLGSLLPLKLGTWTPFSHPLSTPRTLFAFAIGGMQKPYLYLQPNGAPPFTCP